jgi:hypothetical protein
LAYYPITLRAQHRLSTRIEIHRERQEPRRLSRPQHGAAE